MNTQPKTELAATDEDRALKNQMERMVSSYDSYMRRIILGWEDALREMTVNLAGVKPGVCVLEVGCGMGILTFAVKRQAGLSGRVFGIDILPGMIDLSRRKVVQANLDIVFQLGSIEEISFPADQFDVVICSFMIFHMSETVRHKGIHEIYRVLKPQGRFMILDLALPTGAVSKAIAKAFLGFMLDHDLRELVLSMEVAGFSGIEVLSAKYRVLGLPILAYARGSK